MNTQLWGKFLTTWNVNLSSTRTSFPWMDQCNPHVYETEAYLANTELMVAAFDFADIAHTTLQCFTSLSIPTNKHNIWPSFSYEISLGELVATCTSLYSFLSQTPQLYLPITLIHPPHSTHIFCGCRDWSLQHWEGRLAILRESTLSHLREWDHGRCTVKFVS